MPKLSLPTSLRSYSLLSGKGRCSPQGSSTTCSTWAPPPRLRLFEDRGQVVPQGPQGPTAQPSKHRLELVQVVTHHDHLPSKGYASTGQASWGWLCRCQLGLFSGSWWLFTYSTNLHNEVTEKWKGVKSVFASNMLDISRNTMFCHFPHHTTQNASASFFLYFEITRIKSFNHPDNNECLKPQVTCHFPNLFASHTVSHA